MADNLTITLRLSIPWYSRLALWSLKSSLRLVNYLFRCERLVRMSVVK